MESMGQSIQIVIDAADPAKLAEFWALALDYQVQEPPTGFDTWPDFLRSQGVPEESWNDASAIVDPDQVGPRIYIQRVPELKTGKNRVHIDINAGGPHGTPAEEREIRVRAAVDTLLTAGATVVEAREQRGERWVVMQDPEGNEFCVQ
jgi:hypothetical protein